MSSPAIWCFTIENWTNDPRYQQNLVPVLPDKWFEPTYLTIEGSETSTRRVVRIPPNPQKTQQPYPVKQQDQQEE